MRLRLDRQTKGVSKGEKKLMAAVIAVAVIAAIPSLDIVSTMMVHGGYRSLYVDAKQRIVQLVTDIKSAPSKWLDADRSLPTLRLDVKYQEWQKLVADRDRALQEGLIPEDRHYAKATLYSDTSSYDADIRLQGDFLDHVKGMDRWSLRLEMDNTDGLLTTSRFALVSSDVRGHQGPELFRQTMKIAGFDIIAPRNYPVDVVVNGEEWGVMLAEQAFGQDLLAASNRTEGMVVRLDLVDEQVDDGEALRVLRPRVIQEKKILKKPALAKQREMALTLITDFINGDRPASDVFDVEKLGQYLATVDVWAAWHALVWNNWRWYFNPHTARLEPIQSDVAVSPAAHFWLMQKPTDHALISQKMLEDIKVAASYDRALGHLKQLIDSGEMAERLSDVQLAYNRKLYASSPLLGDYDFELMKQQTDCLETDYRLAPCRSFRYLEEDLHLPMHKMQAQSPLAEDVNGLSFMPRPSDGKLAKRYPFIKQRDGYWEIKAGTWKINDYLLTPDNWRVILHAGAKLEFAADAGLMVFGALETRGTEKSPVVMTKQAGGENWSGFTVFGRDKVKASTVKNLEVSSARSPKLGNWQPRGAAYFVNGDVTIDGLTVYDNASEDALNIINSNVDISRLTIRDALSDGFDCDFCVGTMRNSQFINVGMVSGGDGIDTSGSTMLIKDSRFSKIRDKAVSAGENSKLTVENISVSDSNIAVVAKDRSEVNATRVRIDNIKEYSLMSYTKKGIFGPARLIADGVQCLPNACTDQTLAGAGSLLQINGEVIRDEDVNIKALYQGVMKSDRPQ